MASQIFEEKYRITSYLVNLQQKAGLYAILNLIQDVGWQHAVELGFDLAGENLAWVFTRQKLVMQRWPNWNEVVLLRTWLRPANDSPFVFRDYELFIGEEKIGECTSTFTVIDAITRKLGKPNWKPFEKIWRLTDHLSHQPSKIILSNETKELACFEVRNSDLDLNNHVNNTKYAQWVLDSVPVKTLKTASLFEYEINFLAETKKGDHISILETQSADPFAQFQGWRKTDGKTVFAAKMLVKHNE